MKSLLFLLVFLLLLGCTAQTPTEKFNVSLMNASHEDAFISEDDQKLENISFIIQNNEEFDLDCDILLNLNNNTKTSSKKGAVGILQPAQKKKVSLTFEMFYGNTSMNITPRCQKP
jgi:hypothetical protein